MTREPVGDDRRERFESTFRETAIRPEAGRTTAIRKRVAASWRSSTVRVVAAIAAAVALSVLLATSGVDVSGSAVATVGIVLAEAIALYLGYGALTRVATPAVRERIERAARE